MEKRIGKIQSIYFGFGGYQDAEIGIGVTIGSDKDGWGVNDFKGAWGIDRSEYAKWSEEERLLALGKISMFIRDLLNDAKKQKLEQLKGVPVEVTFERNLLKEWRILTEVI